MDPKRPHPLSTGFWLLWFVGVLYWHVRFDPVVGLCWFLVFFHFEFLFHTVTWRNTLSWNVTYYIQQLKPEPAKGPAWLVLAVALPIMLLLFRTAVGLVPGWPGWALGVGLSVPGTFELHYHFNTSKW